MAYWDVSNPDNTVVIPNDNDSWRGISHKGNTITKTSDYIVNELLCYDYSDDLQKELIWSKLKVLDGYPDPFDTLEMSVTTLAAIQALPKGDGRRTKTSITIDNPEETNPDLITRTTVYYLETNAYALSGDHWAELKRELDFLDVYVRDREGTLSATEKTWAEYKATGLSKQQRYVAKGFALYQIPHTQRNTNLSDANFETIYQELKTGINKSYGFLTDPKKIITDMIDAPYDYDVNNGLTSLNNLKLPVEIEDDANDSGAAIVVPADNTYVSSMNSASSAIFDEARTLINNLKAEPDETDSNWTMVDQSSSWFEHSGDPQEPVRTYTYNHKIFYGVHFPHKRIKINTNAVDENDSTFRGSNYSVDGGGDIDEGYQFYTDWRKVNNNSHPTSGDYMDIESPQTYRLGYNPEWDEVTWEDQTFLLDGGYWIPAWEWDTERKVTEMASNTREREISNFEMKRIDVFSYTQVTHTSAYADKFTVEDFSITQDEQTITETEVTSGAVNSWDTINYVRENMILNFDYPTRYGSGSRGNSESLIGMTSGDVPDLTDMTKGAIVARKYSKQSLQDRMARENI